MSITLTGWKEFEDKTGAIPPMLFQEIDAEIGEAANTWKQRAVEAAPADQSAPGIRGGIGAAKVRDMEWEVVSTASYSPFMEWGTKSRARVPAELASYASQFQGSSPGTGELAKAMIYRWAERKGIAKEKWWSVFISIMTSGVHPHPFFFIWQQEIELGLIERLKALLNSSR